MNGQRVVNLYAVEQNGTHSGSYFLRMQNNSGVSWRDSANSYDASLIFDASNRFSFIGTASKATVTIGSANEYIRNPTGSATNLNVMSSDGWVVASGSIGGNLGGNTDFDGVSIWNRFNVANPASLLQLSGGGFYYFTAPAAANPISWTQVASINTAGVLTTTGTGFTYSLGTDTVGALLKLGPGYGIIQSVSGHLYLRTSGGANGVQMDTGSGGLNVTGGPVTSATFKMSGGGQWSGAQARGYGAPIQDVGQGDVILGGPASNLYMHPNLTVGISQTYPTISFFGFSGLNCNGVVTNSARRYKSDIVTIKDALELVLDPELEGTHFTYNPPLAVEKDIQKYGFIADPWHEKAPDTVTLDAEGLPAALDYQQVTAILFQAFKEYVGQTDARINQLEAELSRRNT